MWLEVEVVVESRCNWCWRVAGVLEVVGMDFVVEGVQGEAGGMCYVMGGELVGRGAEQEVARGALQRQRMNARWVWVACGYETENFLIQ